MSPGDDHATRPWSLAGRRSDWHHARPRFTTDTDSCNSYYSTGSRASASSQSALDCRDVRMVGEKAVAAREEFGLTANGVSEVNGLMVVHQLLERECDACFDRLESRE